MSVETPGDFSSYDFIGKLDWLAHHMADMGRNSTFGLAQYFPEQVQNVQDELAHYAGKVIMGGITTNQYYVADGPGATTYHTGKLDYRRYGTNDFAGILQDIQDIHVILPLYGNGEPPQGKILCLEVAPIGDEPAGRLTGFYEERRQQPFARQENTGTPLWVPVRPLQQGSVEFIDLTTELV